MPNQPLTINVTNLGSPTAMVYMSIYGTASNFPSPTGQLKKFNAAPVGGVMQFVINDPDIPYGQYAIALYQDINNNGKLDFGGFMNLKPVEPIGFSNNFKPVISKPTFNDCCFDYDEADNSISIALIKL